ncbi:hypothetical protein IVB45_20740 [Bradyrhizobium sp. 4]|uniref:hypothetical protein n=1 Tax=unclassified Bradyrhizobium TaxID=2631580 RepID=UPI001FFC031F|nr:MULTISPECIES: hypothetical protein [unclassified Bradyrhizobium]MCK1322925.1 hypothetical protein [Bradyrhizobium sp. 156]MCK1402329.1 hypothetical protein [Bradyrhizobium sp. 39]MCK1563632.1 hypothetical protein [Bradyrhizobium sp. 173]MCK1747924.1 hypothetical protein [Bradyrhizobium sp. 135]UPJ32418.1 hypothetical protein IVB45_20740 [Bradyrhizobium sp. 4]
MTHAISAIVLDFEAAALAAVANGGSVSDVEAARDDADDKLRVMKAGADADLLDAIFAAALEIGTKANMALKAARK